MIRTSTVRFFLVVAPAPRWILAAFGVAVMLGAVTLWFNPKEVDAAFGSVLLLQMFAVSNGFGSSASRGHFDPILVSLRRRTDIAVGNLIATSLPGVVAWLVIAGMASVMGQATVALAAQRTVAILVVSGSAWAAGLALPRLASGALWSMLLVCLAMSQRVFGDVVAVVQEPTTGALQILRAAAAVGVCPFLLLGDVPAVNDPRVLALVVFAASMMVAAGMRYIGRREYGLVEPA